MASTSNFRKATLTSWLALAIGIVIVISAGTLYGRYSQRWGPPAELTAAGGHLDTMPSQFGPWQLLESLDISESTIDMLECAGYSSRRYLNQDTGQSISVALIVGPAGPIAVHTPEICYSSRAYKLQSKRRAISMESAKGDSHSVWSVDFRARDVAADQLRVLYAWNRGSRWEASKAPRYEFAGSPMLYKIQISGQITDGASDKDHDPCQQFFEALVSSDWQLAPPAKQED